jgi:putative FmdB family regulatory protein
MLKDCSNASVVELSIESIMDIMPKYEYTCTDGHGDAEVERSFNDPVTIPRCETCFMEMRRVYTSTGAIFKGTGWGSKP